MSGQNKDWTIELEREDYAGRPHIFMLANGYMGVNGCFSEVFGREGSTILVLGIYDQVGEAWNEIINEPNFLYSEFYADGEKIALNDKNTEEFSASLDIKHAIVKLGYIWKSSKGKKIKVSHERIVCADRKNTAGWKFSFESLSDDADMNLVFGIDGEVIDDNGVHLDKFSSEELEDGVLLNCFTQLGKYQISCSNNIEITASGKKVVNGAAEIGLKCIKTSYKFRLAKGKAAQGENIAHILTSRDSQDTIADAERLAGAKWKFDELFDSHSREFVKLWETADIVIDGDDKAQKYMRYSIYALLSSMPRAIDYASVPARMLSTQTYKGAIFWDMDTHAYPFCANVFPQMARNHLLYRYKCLPHALKKAERLGYEGAFYAWESLDSGQEATKKFVWKDTYSGRMMRNYFGDRQYHIPGDVIYALWQYYQATGDVEFLINYGAEMTLQAARFAASLVYYKTCKGRYEIMQTVCPDEYHEEVNNNPFTNRILQFVIEKAFEVKILLEEKAPEKLKHIMQMMKLTEEELEYWQDVKERMYIIEPDKNFVIGEFDGYFDLEDITIEEFNRRTKGKDNEYFGFPIGLAVHTQIIKQSDIVHLMHMFKNDYHPVIRKANYNYYEQRTDQRGSSGSHYAHSIVAAQIGLGADAYRYFMRSCGLDLESVHQSSKANTRLGGLHLGSCGGSWQVIAYGFAGMDLTDCFVGFNPAIPSHWKSMKFNINYKGQILQIEAEQEKITVCSLKDNDKEVNIRITDRPVMVLKPGEKITEKYQKIGKQHYVY